MRKPMLWVALCATLIVGGWSATALAEDETFELDETSFTGVRRSISTTREYSESQEWIVGGEAVATTTRKFWTRSHIHEWQMESHTSGAPRRVMRTYERLKRESEAETDTKYTDPIKSARAEISDPRKGGIFVLSIDEKGARKIEGNPHTIIWEHDKKRIRDPLEMDVLPHKKLAVGATWTISGDKCEVLYDAEDSLVQTGDPEPFDSGELKVTLVEVTRPGGMPKAKLRIEGVLNFRLQKKAAYGDDIVTDIKTKATVKGEAIFDLRRGYLGYRLLEVSFERSGKRDNSEIRGSATLRDEREYARGYIYEAAPDNGSDDIPDGPVKEMQAFRQSKVDPGHVVLAQNHPDGGRLIVFDPVAGKRVKTLMVLPAGKFVDHVALAPSRDRIAFSSTFNNEITVAPWNSFVLETASGKLNQVTPSWATGDGVAKPLPPSGGKVTGSVEFYDDYENAVRQDDISGDVQLDQSRCHVVLGAGGGFSLSDAPAGIMLVRIKAKLPRPRHGVPRGVTVGIREASIVTLATVKAGETTDLGTLRLQIGAADMVYCNPTWTTQGLLGNLHGSGMLWRAGYPTREWHLDTRPTFSAMTACLALNADAKTGACTTWGKEGSVSFFEPATRRETLTLSLEKIGAQVPLEARLAWLDGNELLTGAMAKCRYDFMADAPALVAASQLTKEARVWKTLPEWTGRCIRDVAVTGDGQVLIVVSGKLLTTTEERSELYVWDVSLDAVRRLTGFNHVLGVSNTGR